MTKLVMIGIIILSLFLAKEPAAQPYVACGPLESAMATIKGEFGEVLVGRGVTSSGFLFEVYASYTEGTWSALIIRPDDVACLVMHGDGFEFFLPGEKT